MTAPGDSQAALRHGTPAPLHLVPGEDLADGVRRILRLELDRLLATIDADAVDHDSTVHEVRRTAKRLRAVIRLVRDGASAVYADVNTGLRDTARLLADDRDAAVVAATAEDLAAGTDPETAAAMAPVVLRLVERRDRQVTEGVGDRLADARERLATMRWQIAGWALPEGPALDVLLAGHGRTHDRARRSMHEALAHPTNETWHGWRKRVKYDRHQTEVLVAAWEPVLGLRADLLHDLSDWLGEDHDLAVLREVVTDLDGSGTAACLVALEARRASLQRAARALGTRCYALPTDAHIDRLSAWWDQATDDVAAEAVTPRSGP